MYKGFWALYGRRGGEICLEIWGLGTISFLFSEHKAKINVIVELLGEITIADRASKFLTQAIDGLHRILIRCMERLLLGGFRDGIRKAQKWYAADGSRLLGTPCEKRCMCKG